MTLSLKAHLPPQALFPLSYPPAPTPARSLSQNLLIFDHHSWGEGCSWKPEARGQDAAQDCYTAQDSPPTEDCPAQYISCCSVTESCPPLCDPMNCSTPGFPVLHCLPEFAQTHVHCSTMPSNHHIPFSCPQSFPESGSFPMSRLFASGDQSIGASASASVLPMNIQG